MIILYFALIGGLLWRHMLTLPAAGAFIAIGFAVWLFIEAVGATL